MQLGKTCTGRAHQVRAKDFFHKRRLVSVYPNASRVTAVCVANVAKDEFEQAVESD